MTNREPSAEPAPTFEMRIAIDLAEIDRVNAGFNKFATANGVCENVRRSLNLVFDEILNNAISYGFERPDMGRIDVSAELGNERIYVTISDDGKPYDPLSRPEPNTTLDLEVRDIGGLGVHLIRNVMDDVSYEYRDGCNVLVLQKSLAPPPPSSAEQGAT